MELARRIFVKPLAILGMGMAASLLTGCQTYPAGFGGLTLPSPNYLRHYPQYLPPDPPFPLQRELDSMQDPEGLLRRAPGGGGASTPLPAPPGVLPAPAPVAPAPMAK